MLFCRYQQLPAALTQRVLAYLKYKWLRTHGLNERKVLAELPPKLSQDVNLELYKDLIEAVPLFRGVEKGFIKAIVKYTMGRVSDGAPHTHSPIASPRSSLSTGTPSRSSSCRRSTWCARAA